MVEANYIKVDSDLTDIQSILTHGSQLVPNNLISNQLDFTI